MTIGARPRTAVSAREATPRGPAHAQSLSRGTAASDPQPHGRPEVPQAWSATVPLPRRPAGYWSSREARKAPNTGPPAGCRPAPLGAEAKATVPASGCPDRRHRSSGICREPGGMRKGHRRLPAIPCQANAACPRDGSTDGRPTYRGTSPSARGCAGQQSHPLHRTAQHSGRPSGPSGASNPTQDGETRPA